MFKLKKEVSTLQLEKKELEETVEERTAEVTDFLEENHKLQGQIDDDEIAFDKKLQQIDELTRQNTTLKTEVNTYKQATEQLEEEKQAHEGENELITHAVEEAQEAAKEAKEDLKQSEDRAFTIENNLDQCIEEKHSLKVRINGYETLLTAHEDVIATREAETEQANTKAATAEKKASQILVANEWLQEKLTEADEQLLAKDTAVTTTKEQPEKAQKILVGDH